MSDDNGVDALGHGSTVSMQELDEVKALRHLILTEGSLAREHAEARVAALAAGGRIVVESAAPSAWILSDRAGKRV